MLSTPLSNPGRQSNKYEKTAAIRILREKKLPGRIRFTLLQLTQFKAHRRGSRIIESSGSAGNALDIESLFLHYSHLLYLVCNKYLRNEEESKDAVMEIFLKLLTGEKEYTVANVPAWLHAVTKNHCLMRIRKAKNIKIHYMPPEEIDLFGMENDDFVHHDDEKGIQWHELLIHLSNEQKTCVEMFYFRKMSYREIARRSAMNIKQVKSHLQNGKRNLKRLLKKA